jgi:hypothetical protein
MKRPSLLALLLLGSSAFAAPVDCLDTETALAYWQPIRDSAGEEALDADALAVELVSCLGSPDPDLRDRIGYELYTYWLRNDALTDETRRFLLASLSANLGDVSADSSLRRSFSALILAELMRSDANRPFMTGAERADLLRVATGALTAENDFRGLEPDIGWVHPVAHLADLLWRFALHPDTTGEETALLLASVRSKVAPVTVSYAFNEGDRLARVVSTIVQRELVPADDIAEWIATFATPGSMERWSQAFQSPEGMAELHNTKQFLRSLSDQLAGTDVPSEVISPLDELVQGFTQLI